MSSTFYLVLILENDIVFSSSYYSSSELKVILRDLNFFPIVE